MNDSKRSSPGAPDAAQYGDQDGLSSGSASSSRSILRVKSNDIVTKTLVILSDDNVTLPSSTLKVSAFPFSHSCQLAVVEAGDMWVSRMPFPTYPHIQQPGVGVALPAVSAGS